MKSRLLPAYEKSVFINCPFDRQYENLMLALVFSVAAHGLVPRSAQETEGDPEPRFARVLQLISSCKYSIHDISRSKGEGAENLGRFNMPLELGMAAAFRFEREGSGRPHRWLALVPEGYGYQQFISDLAGFDPARHDSSVPSIIREGSAWLRTLDDALESAPSAADVLRAFSAFRDQVARLRTEALDKRIWADILLAASRTVPRT
jgi:hypothetical protein